MEPEVSLQHSQEPATWPYAEPARSSPYPHIPLPEHPTSYYPTTYAWVSSVVSFLQVSPPKPCTRPSLPHMRYMPCPSHSSRFYHPHNIGWGVQIIKLDMCMCIYKYIHIHIYILFFDILKAYQHAVPHWQITDKAARDNCLICKIRINRKR